MSKRGQIPHIRRRTGEIRIFISGKWWSQSGSNRRPQACKASALPTELWPQRLARIFINLRTNEQGHEQMVGREGVEPSTSRLSGVRSNHLSYRPPRSPCRPNGRRRREPAQAALPHANCLALRSVSRMKGHEDGGNVLWTGGDERELRLPP